MSFRFWSATSHPEGGYRCCNTKNFSSATRWGNGTMLSDVHNWFGRPMASGGLYHLTTCTNISMPLWAPQCPTIRLHLPQQRQLDTGPDIFPRATGNAAAVATSEPAPPSHKRRCLRSWRPLGIGPTNMLREGMIRYLGQKTLLTWGPIVWNC